MPQRLRLNEDNRKWWTLAAMCFALFMLMLDNTVVNVALPSIQTDLDASISSSIARPAGSSRTSLARRSFSDPTRSR